MQHLSQFLLHQRGFWHRLPMDELSELYTSMMLKTFGLSLIGIFVPIYLYEEGFSIGQVVLFMILNYLARTISSSSLARLGYRYGAKRLMRQGLGLTVLFLVMLLTLSNISWPLWLLAGVDAVAINLFYLGYHIDFSRAKKLDEFGKEAERMFTLAKVAAATAPFIGGVIATLIAPEATIVVALLAVIGASWPLARADKNSQPFANQIKFKWDFKRLWRSYVSLGALGLDQTVSVVFWPFFAALFIFSGQIYFELGVVTSVSAISAILVVHALGKLVDNHKGGLLLTYSTWLSGLLHGFRALATNFGQVLGINILSEWFNAGSHMPYFKGMYDEADHASNRVGYIGVMEASANAGRLVFWLVVGGLMLAVNSDETAFRLGFVLATGLTLLVLVHNFKVLKLENNG